MLSFHRSNSTDKDERLSEVYLVLDEVDLCPVQFAFVKNAVIGFLRRNDGVLAQPVSVVWVKADGVYTSAFPTTDGDNLAQEIGSDHVFLRDWKFYPEQQPGVTRQPVPHQPGVILQTVVVTLRDTLWNEVVRAVYSLAVKCRDRQGRKAVIWIGYGWSVLGSLDGRVGPFPVLVELSARMREARMVIYDITSWPDPEMVNHHGKILDYHQFLRGVRSPSDPGLQSPVPYLALPVLALQSGGLVLDHSKDLEGDIGRCITDASDFYTVSFDPPHAAQPDEYHDLAVLTKTAQLPIRTTHGYYNQPVFYKMEGKPSW